jgi:transposase
MEKKYYVGMDIHKAKTYAIAKDEEGNKVAEDEFRNTKEKFLNFLKDLPNTSTKIVIESTGVWEYIYSILDELGYEVKLANPFKTKAIAYAKIKTDKIDANTLCDLLRGDLIAECYIPKKEIRELRDLTRMRGTFVKEGTRLKNHIRAHLNKRGIKVNSRFIGKKAIKDLSETYKDDYVLITYLQRLQEHKKQMLFIEKLIYGIAIKNHQTILLMTIPGIAEVRALQIISEIGDINRFDSSEKLASFCGLVPGIRQSANTIKVGRLVKAANKNLKFVFIEASWNIIRTPGKNRFREFFDKLSEKKGEQKAICAVARKLCCTTYAMLKNDREFIFL